MAGVLVDEGPLGTHHAELVALGVGEHGPGLGAGLPDVHPPGTKGKDALDLGLLLARIGAQVEVEAILGRLDVAHGHEADADRRGRVGADHDLALPFGEDPPTQHLRPEAGEGREVMGVDDEVMQRDRHARQCAWSVTSPPARGRGASASKPDGQTPALDQLDYELRLEY